ncbi:hypothetical protein Tco_1314808, partial [Tanacetum coccineum]
GSFLCSNRTLRFRRRSLRFRVRSDSGSGSTSSGLEARVEFKRISLTRFRSCTSRSHYQSVLKHTTRTACVLDDEQQVYMELCPNEILIDLDGSRLYSALLLFGDRRLEWTATFSISTISE